MLVSLPKSEFSSISLFHLRVSSMLDFSVEEQTMMHPRAPRRYILETALNLSCPAISQIWSLTSLPSLRLSLSLVWKSQPMVGLTFSSNF